MNNNDSADRPIPTRASPLPTLTTTVFSGADCAQFLQGYLTCDTQRLVEDSALSAALCNIKGRVIANGWAFAGSSATADTAATESIHFVTHHSVAETLRDTLKRYMVFSKTTAQPSTMALFGTVDEEKQPGAVILDARRNLYLAHAADQSALQDDAAPNAFMNSLLEDRMALVDADSTDGYLPQMLGLSAWGAVDFAKGCYLGQEVVARAEHRGQVKRQLFALTAVNDAIDGQSLPVGCPVEDQNSKVLGTVVQRCNAPVSSGRALALAVLNIRALEAAQPLRLQHSAEPVAILPQSEAPSPS